MSLLLSTAWALGAEEPGCDLDAALRPALGAELAGCVRHTSLDDTDSFWYRGTAGAASAMAARLAGNPRVPLDVSVRIGEPPVCLDGAALDFRVDVVRRWRWYTGARVARTRLEVWSTGGLDAGALSLPASASVVTTEQPEADPLPGVDRCR